MFDRVNLSWPVRAEFLRDIVSATTAKMRMEFDYPPGIDFSRSGKRVLPVVYEFDSEMKHAIRELLQRSFGTSSTAQASRSPSQYWDHQEQGQQPSNPPNQRPPETQTESDPEYDRLVALIERQFPTLNPDSYQYSQEIMDAVLELRDDYLGQGMSLVAATKRAVEVHFQRPVISVTN